MSAVCVYATYVPYATYATLRVAFKFSTLIL